MSLDNFYEFDTQGYMTQFYAFMDRSGLYEKNIDNRLLYGKYDNIDFPIIFQQRKSDCGKKMTDFLNTGCGPLLTPISDKVLDILVQNNITGWKTYPVKIFNKHGIEIFGYHGFSITGRCKDVNLSLLQKKVDYQYIKDGPVYQYYKGFPIDLSTWDKSDIFLLSGTRYLFISEKVYKLFKYNKITNIDCKKVSDKIIKEDSEVFLRNKEFQQSEIYYW